MPDDFLYFLSAHKRSQLTTASSHKQPAVVSPDVRAPELGKLMELRDVLVALKGPLADKPGLRESIESQLFSTQTDDRVLGKASLERPSTDSPGRLCRTLTS